MMTCCSGIISVSTLSSAGVVGPLCLRPAIQPLSGTPNKAGIEWGTGPIHEILRCPEMSLQTRLVELRGICLALSPGCRALKASAFLESLPDSDWRQWLLTQPCPALYRAVPLLRRQKLRKGENGSKWLPSSLQPSHLLGSETEALLHACVLIRHQEATMDKQGICWQAAGPQTSQPFRGRPTLGPRLLSTAQWFRVLLMPVAAPP